MHLLALQKRVYFLLEHGSEAILTNFRANNQ